jgi:hypothetical protein
MKNNFHSPLSARLRSWSWLPALAFVAVWAVWAVQPTAATISFSCDGDAIVTANFDAIAVNEYRLQGSGPGIPSSVRISSHTAPESFQWTLPGPGTWSVTLYWRRPPAVPDWDVSGFNNTLAFRCGPSKSGQWFNPDDDRINRQAYAGAAVYCDADNSRVAIYGIDAQGVGFPAIFVPYADLPETPTDANLLIAELGNIQFYRLTSGEYNVITGPDAEGKWYQVFFDGCPHTYVQAAIFQNGVLTPTERYPRLD